MSTEIKSLAHVLVLTSHSADLTISDPIHCGLGLDGNQTRSRLSSQRRQTVRVRAVIGKATEQEQTGFGGSM